MIRAVIDTNILVSSLYNRLGSEVRVTQAIRGGVVKPCFSGGIFQEYQEVLTRSKFAFPAAEIADLLREIRRVGIYTTPATSTFVVPDPSDAKFMHCAMTAQAHYLVTGNRRHFRGPYQGLARVVNARELLAQITLSQPPPPASPPTPPRPPPAHW